MSIFRPLMVGLLKPLTGSLFPSDVLLPFTFQVKTDNTGTSNNDQFTIPTVSTGNYLGSVVDWGDGGALEHIDTYNDARWTHTSLGGAGTYTVKIYKKFTGISFANGGDKSKLISINQWGIFDFGNVAGAFYGCNNLTSITATDKPGLTGTTDFSNNFRLTGAMLTIFGIASWDWSTVENLLATWLNSGFRSSLDGANFDSLNYLGYTFFGSNFNSLIGQDQVGGRLPLVTDMTQTYSYNTDFDQNLGVYNVENVTVMDNVLSNSGLSQANYDLTLISWAAQDVNSGLTPNFGTSTYSIGDAATAHYDLITYKSWTIILHK